VKKLFGGKIHYHESEYDVLQNADALLIATEWPEYRNPDFDRMATTMKNKVIFDGRNLYSLETVTELGFTYYSIGRKTVKR
jgi:UDPglucose 6-dehydrogenase